MCTSVRIIVALFPESSKEVEASEPLPDPRLTIERFSVIQALCREVQLLLDYYSNDCAVPTRQHFTATLPELLWLLVLSALFFCDNH